MKEELQLLSKNFICFFSAITSRGEVRSEVNKNSNTETKGRELRARRNTELLVITGCLCPGYKLIYTNIIHLANLSSNPVI